MARTSHRPVKEKLGTRLFRAVHNRHLIYNACWEDPAIDRRALNLKGDDRVVVLTSGGCNALDYLLAGAKAVHAVDMNPVQNALLELKTAAIKLLDYRSFFSLFGQGRSPFARQMYLDVLRAELSRPARRYWDRRIHFFVGKGRQDSFYHRGLFGSAVKSALDFAARFHRLRAPMEQLLSARTLEEQRAIYHGQVANRIWMPWLRWFVKFNPTLTWIGMPPRQGKQLARQYPGGSRQFITDVAEAVLTRLPLRDNYFWRLHLQGHYTPSCCPEYLRADNFERLKSGLLDRLTVHTDSINGFLRDAQPGISKFVLLDHMDWLSNRALADEWTSILTKARPGGRVIFRSCGLRVPYLDHLRIRFRQREVELGSILQYHPGLASELHAQDRVHTYGSFYIADLPDDIRE